MPFKIASCSYVFIFFLMNEKKGSSEEEFEEIKENTNKDIEKSEF